MLISSVSLHFRHTHWHRCPKAGQYNCTWPIDTMKFVYGYARVVANNSLGSASSNEYEFDLDHQGTKSGLNLDLEHFENFGMCCRSLFRDSTCDFDA